MGAWGYGVFDDDTTCDFVDDIADSDDPLQMLVNAFRDANGADYLEYDRGCAVWVSAVVIDAILNGTKYSDAVENFKSFIATHKKLPAKNLKNDAIKALEKLLGENSELHELWSENEELYPKWKEGILQLKGRLQ